MEILKFNTFNFLNKSRKATVHLILLCTKSSTFFLFLGPNCSGAGAKKIKMLQQKN